MSPLQPTRFAARAVQHGGLLRSTPKSTPLVTQLRLSSTEAGRNNSSSEESRPSSSPNQTERGSVQQRTLLPVVGTLVAGALAWTFLVGRKKEHIGVGVGNSDGDDKLSGSKQRVRNALPEEEAKKKA